MVLITSYKNVPYLRKLLEEHYANTPPEFSTKELRKLLGMKTPLQRVYENMVYKTYGIGKPKPISHTVNKKRKSKRRIQSLS